MLSLVLIMTTNQSVKCMESETVSSKGRGGEPGRIFHGHLKESITLGMQENIPRHSTKKKKQS